jgi:hypothetical protein
VAGAQRPSRASSDTSIHHSPGCHPRENAFSYGSNFPTRFSPVHASTVLVSRCARTHRISPSCSYPVPTGSLAIRGSQLRYKLLRTFSGRLRLIRLGLRPYPALARVSSAKDSKNARLPTNNHQCLPKYHRVMHSAQRPQQGATVRRLSYQRPPVSRGANRSRFPLTTLVHFSTLISHRLPHSSHAFAMCRGPD